MFVIWCSLYYRFSCSFFFFNDTATTEIYTLSLHDALPILVARRALDRLLPRVLRPPRLLVVRGLPRDGRSEEHTSELQSRQYLVCRLLLEKKKKYKSCRTLYIIISLIYVYSLYKYSY